MDLYPRYKEVRQHTELLCEPLCIEDFIPQPVPFASPPKWHLAHTTWFFEEMVLKPSLVGYREFDSSYGFLFNSYYQSSGERALRADRGAITRPTVETIYAYRGHVDRAVKALLSQGNTSKSVLDLIVLGIQHEQQHQELLQTDLKYVLGLNPTSPAYSTQMNVEHAPVGASQWLGFEEALVTVGSTGENFCFDNEISRHRSFLEPYQICDQLVSNAEYLEFLLADGYSDFRYWLDDGWHWVNENSISAPLYWRYLEGSWYEFTLSGLQPLDLNSAVCHVSFYEAAAYANFRQARLPTEFEWEHASSSFQWGQRWEWTSSAYLPYPGFTISPGAVGEYNGKFMVNQMVLRGASTITSAGHSRSTYRNFFHPHFQWQFSGIRLAQ